MSTPKYTVCSLQFRAFSTESCFVVFIIRRNKDGKLTNRICTIPNIMSGIRLVLAPVIGVLTIKGFFLPSLCSIV